MPSIDLVIITNSRPTHKSEEFDFLLRKLGQSIRGAGNVVFLAGSSPPLRSPVCDALLTNLSAESRVAVLAHPHLLLAAGCLDRLDAALAAGSVFADACDSGRPEPLPPQDFATVGGMERYVARSDGLPPHPCRATPWPLLRLTTRSGLERLRDEDVNPCGVRIPGAYVFDFGGYYQGTRAEVLPLVPARTKKILDVGGGEGRFLATVKWHLGCETHLCELNADVAENARERVDHVHVGDFFQLEVPTDFSCITFLDMLEHVVHPERYLRRAAQLLEPGGVIVASIPNVGHWTVIADLIEGRWDYAAAGIHCITHLRFFTRRTIEDLFSDAGLNITRCEPVVIACPPAWRNAWSASSGLLVATENLDAYAYLVQARPA